MFFSLLGKQKIKNSREKASPFRKKKPAAGRAAGWFTVLNDGLHAYTFLRLY
jgi:hypothetical protein